MTRLLLFKQIICRISATRNDSILKSMCLSLEFRSCSGFPIVSDKIQIPLSGKVVDRKFKAFFEAAMRMLGKMNFHFSSALEKIGNFQPNKKSASFNASPLPSPDNEHVKAILLYANSRALLPRSCSTNAACERKWGNDLQYQRGLSMIKGKNARLRKPTYRLANCSNQSLENFINISQYITFSIVA